MERLLEKHTIKISKLENDMCTKESKENFNDLLRRFEVFSDMETIDQLNNKFLPKIEHLYKNIGIMNQKSDELKLVI